MTSAVGSTCSFENSQKDAVEDSGYYVVVDKPLPAHCS